ncbi:MAG: lysophospholipid acyltransferase family protein [Janthinobacterium lividum]
MPASASGSFVLRWASYLIFIPLMIFVTVACGTLSLICSTWDKSGRQQHALAHFWAKLMLRIALSPVKVVNPQNLITGGAVFASNHLSYMDTPALFGSLPFQFRILANHYLFRYPFVGWHLTRSGQVPIDQSSMRSQVSGLMRGVATLKSGMPILIFPDGSRSSDGHVRQFMSGAAYMAIKAQVPLVPLALIGTYELLPMHTYHLTPRPLLLVACEPLATTGLTSRDADTLTQKAMDAIATVYYAHSELVRPAVPPACEAKIFGTATVGETPAKPA